jgi:hypothetical protein
MGLYVKSELYPDDHEFKYGDSIIPDLIDEITVDGYELQDIRDRIPGLPIPNRQVVKFYGDTAKMIIGNLYS